MGSPCLEQTQGMDDNNTQVGEPVSELASDKDKLSFPYYNTYRTLNISLGRYGSPHLCSECLNDCSLVVFMFKVGISFGVYLGHYP